MSVCHGFGRGRRGHTNHHYVKGDVVNAPALGIDTRVYVDAELSSEALRDACLDYFSRFERRHFLKEREGMIAVLYGWSTLECARRLAA